MILHASNGCFLTQSSDVPNDKRVFLSTVSVQKPEDYSKWKEVPRSEKESFYARTAIVDVDNLTVEGIDNVANLLSEIAANINSVEMTDEQAIERTGFFPKWEDKAGEVLPVGFRLSHGGGLYEVIQEHTASAEWAPGEGTESLFKGVVLMEETTGTAANPIAYDGNMELTAGLYYSQDGVTYLCTRDTGTPVYHALSELVGLYVEQYTTL